jgi:uncharacterized membrane protein/nitrite reductase/ring-hydroxylating ferredoxin subunit
MRSTAHFKGEPIHPALVHFPLAFLIGAFFFDLAGVLLDKPGWWAVGAYLSLVGVIAALLAAVPGFIDYLYTVPPKSSGRTMATRHMVLNLVAVAAFALARYLRGHPDVEPEPILIVLESVGFLLLVVAGKLGAGLIYRLQIGVDTSYAADGRWSERKTGEASGGVVVARAGELELNQMRLVRAGGGRIVLARTESGYVAFDDACTHQGGSLAGGSLICGTVQCPWHGSQFDVKDGAVRAGPAGKPIRTYRVEESDSEIRLLL